MEVFSELKNIWFEEVCQILQDIYLQKKTYTNKEIFDRLKLLKYMETETEVEEIVNLIRSLPAPTSSFTLPEYRLTTPELSWLKTMISDTEVSFLLSPTLRAKLIKTLANIPSFWDSTIWQKDIPYNKDISSKQHILHAFYQGLLKEKQITWSTQYQTVHTGTPIRLEYDIVSNTYTFWILGIQATEPIRISLQDIITLEMLPNSKAQDVETIWQDYLTRSQRILQLELNPRNNAAERCFQLFSSYAKEAIVNKELDTYHLKITYYDFDTKEVVEKLLSLGNTVTVLEPSTLREELINILKQAMAHYTTQTSETAQN